MTLLELEEQIAKGRKGDQLPESGDDPMCRLQTGIEAVRGAGGPVVLDVHSDPEAPPLVLTGMEWSVGPVLSSCSSSSSSSS